MYSYKQQKCSGHQPALLEDEKKLFQGLECDKNSHHLQKVPCFLLYNMTIKRRNSNSKRTWDDFINDSVNDFMPLEKTVISLHIGEKVWEKSFFFF